MRLIANQILKRSLLVLLYITTVGIFAQTGLVKGTITDENNRPVANVSISYGQDGTTSNDSGFYILDIPAGKTITLTFSHVSFHKQTKKISVKKDKTLILDLLLQSNIETIKEVTVTSQKDQVTGITNVDIETIKNISSANPGIEGTLKITGLGTSSDNELSTQYKVRGGNYDENLVYVNGIEIYRPFLIRSGQQEGLSFLNPELTSQVKFSSGGFQAKYGDKLSSVLDINYRKPQGFAIGGSASFMGASLNIEGLSKNGESTALLGMRYRNNALLVKSQDIETNYKPRFADVQTHLTHQWNDAWKVSFLGNFSLNDYHYIPTTRATQFGTIDEPQELIVYYDGNENDRYRTAFGALQLEYATENLWKWYLTTSVFNTQEEEFYDIEAAYFLGQPNPDAGTEDYGESEYIEGIGSQLNHARNELDALIGNMELKGSYYHDKNLWEFGVKVQNESIKDRLIEWEMIDSAGFSVRPPAHEPNLQPYEPYEGPLTPYQSVRATNTTDIQRIMGFAQWSKKTVINNHEWWFNAGLRAQQWTLEKNSQIALSPRFQVALKPGWEKEMLFRLSGGLYAQPPFYKELRDVTGSVIPEVKAQKSAQIVVGNDYSFHLWDRPFKWTTELYYKYLTDVNPYTLDNVRIRYAADNNAIAYAYGLDFRINGAFVPGTESWFNFGYLKTEENIDNRGYIARPSDQRLKFALLFQDYVPQMPNLKMYLNLVYNTGVPGGSPTYADPYDFQLRLSDYKRADLGIFYIIKDKQNTPRSATLSRFKELSIGAEILNLFDMQNAVTNTWVRDIYSKRMYGVKNYMTGRVFNVKVKFQF